MVLLFDFINSFSKMFFCLNKNLTLKIHSASSTGSNGKYMICIFLGLRWWQRLIVRGLHGHCIAAEVAGSRKSLLTPSVQLRPWDFAFFFSNCAEDDLQSKSRLTWQSVRLLGRRLSVVQLTHHPLFLSTASSVWHFPDPLHWTSLLQLSKDANSV